jgi:Arc/MetJ-type ribon-helix-helix transcriptional regulator
MSEQRKQRGRPALSDQPSEAHNDGRSPVISTRLPKEEYDDLDVLRGLARCEMSEFLRRLLRQLIRDRQALIQAARRQQLVDRRDVDEPSEKKPTGRATWGR